MAPLSDVDEADRLTRRRARMIPMLAVVFIVGQAAYFMQPPGERAIDHIRIIAWLIWVAVLLMLLATGGALIKPKQVRALMDDESTRANRLRGYAVGFWAAIGAAILLYAIAVFVPVTGPEAVHLIVTAAIAGALLTFARLERRFHADG